eukprot:TRINITY_DN13767_c0_g1_i2.p1 TRINITY_DN13767_c0_g1~~TRINITY_DN13767_c0_g1_i2.p1  ORF type:complete len:595 (+),score=118.14 TRINITY_DN13767_c0_g1_i2:3-1787(+)
MATLSDLGFQPSQVQVQHPYSNADCYSQVEVPASHGTHELGADMSEGELTTSAIPTLTQSQSQNTQSHFGEENEFLEAEAGSLRKVVKVEDWLMDVGAGYEEHVAKLRAERVKQELMEIKDKPTITQHAQSLTRGNVPVEDRLMKVHYEKKQKERARQHEEQNEPQEHSYRPIINELSKEKTSKWGLDLNGVRKADKINHLRNQLLEEEGRTMRDTPHIDPNSKKLATNRTKGMSVEDYLLFSDKKHKEEMYEKHEQESQCVQGQPSITKHAAALKREGDVSTRLYEQRFGFNISELNASAASRAEKGLADAMRHRGEQEPFHPKINQHKATNRDPHRREKVEEKLHKKHREIVRERELAYRKLQEEAREASAMVHTSKQSDSIYANADLERTAQRRQQRKSLGNEAKTPTKKTTSVGFSKRLTEWEAMRTKKRQDTDSMKAELVRKEMAECTFDPFKSPALRRARSSGVSRHSRGGYTEGTLAERSTSWLIKRESKLNQQKQEGKKSELEGCTFVPYINQDIPDMSENADNAYGYNEFINRLRKARTDKEECKQREEETFSQGKKWTGQATTPRVCMHGTFIHFSGIQLGYKC